jgi:hypothetical protein
MKTFITSTIMALAATLTIIALTASTASADQPKAVLLDPNPGFGGYLPRFGFNSFNISGYGDRVTYVQWGGLAAQMGLEPGDVVMSMNGFPLHYHGAWNDALNQAMMNGGLVQLTIRDVRTGWLTTRQLYLGGGFPGTPKHQSPITPKYQVTGYGPTTSHIVVGGSYPAGPITTKKKVGPYYGNNHLSISDVIKMHKD